MALAAKHLGGQCLAPRPRITLGKVEVAAEPLVQRKKRSMLGRRRRRQEQRVRPDQLLHGTGLLPVRRTGLHVITLATEDQSGASLWIAVGPLLDHLLVVEQEAVLVHHTIEHEVDLEPRRPVTRLPVEHEGASVDLTLRISVAKRVKDEVAHVVHCLEQVALS